MEKEKSRASAVRDLQCLSHFFNFILLVVGGGATALGFWIYFTLRMDEEKRGTLDIAGLMHYVANLCTISEGIFLVLLVFVGVIAICTMHRCTLIWYFSLVMVACVFSLMFTIMTFIVFFGLNTTINTAMDDFVQNEYGLFGKEHTTQLLDNIQISFNCCGSKSYENWRSSEWYKLQRLGYFDPLDAPAHPESCCVMTSDGQPVNKTGCVHTNALYPNKFIHKSPCSEEIHEWLRWYTLYLSCAGVAVFFSTVFEIGTASALLRTLGPLQQEHKPKAADKQHLTTVYSESEDSWSSSKERPVKKSNQQTKNSPKSATLEKKTKQKNKKVKKYDKKADTKNQKANGNGHVANGAYVNTSFRDEAEEQATPL